ncbi:FAD-dependent oxidoreductase [Sphingobacterium phlebotomi]|uniref:FAD-dependent oxidoreductase n=1 Tax=Sphingobacterium phlebotomi TaxID=2605433 RepID=A0A5D4H2H1_9SPHI|nr:FAD-dependent oxidoreductase [Sphingobacterium phlebotomi]TYR33010.1 FAD-dependent oxidoreductase [Sphingobacterium phlebotomi]
MQRDGINKSIWQEVTVPGLSAPRDQEHVEIIVVGGGITGLTAALKLQEAGRRCVIMEANTIGFGTTSGTSAHINTVLDTPYTDIIEQHGLEAARTVVASTRKAISIINKNKDQYEIDCDFTRCSGFMYAENEEEKKELKEIKEALEQVGIPCSEVDEIPVPASFMYAIEFEEQARFHPTKYLAGLAKAYISLGGQIRERTVVQHVKEENDMLVAKTAEGDVFSADFVLYATHTPPGIQLMNFRLAPYRSYIQVWELMRQIDWPEALVYDMQEPFHYFRTVEQGGKSYLLIGGQDHKTAHHDNEKKNFRELEAYVRSLYVVNKKIYEWSSQYYESQDSLPFIGYYPGKKHRRELLSSGYGGNGMIFGTLGGSMMADLVLHGKTDFQDIYSPSRIGPLSAIRNLLVENYDVAKHFVKDRFFLEEIEELAELGRGEGKILNYKGKRIGLFKGEQGELFAIDPVCRHAACIVKWNNTERSWDCPCHGARYAPDGSLLNGPSVAPLKIWQLEKKK